MDSSDAVKRVLKGEKPGSGKPPKPNKDKEDEKSKDKTSTDKHKRDKENRVSGLQMAIKKDHNQINNFLIIA